MSTHTSNRPPRASTSLELIAERLEREAKGSSLESVNRIRRRLFGMLPEDVQNHNECRGRRSASVPTKEQRLGCATAGLLQHPRSSAVKSL
jgi:hypothetical protein